MNRLSILLVICSAIGAGAAYWFWPQDVIRKVVATIDNLPRKTLGARLNPVRPPQAGSQEEATRDSQRTLGTDAAAAVRTTPCELPMDNVTVCRWKSYDIVSDKEKSSNRWGTLEAIDSLGLCVALVETARQVRQLLDDSGFIAGDVMGRCSMTAIGVRI